MNLSLKRVLIAGLLVIAGCAAAKRLSQGKITADDVRTAVDVVK